MSVFLANQSRRVEGFAKKSITSFQSLLARMFSFVNSTVELKEGRSPKRSRAQLPTTFPARFAWPTAGDYLNVR